MNSDRNLWVVGAAVLGVCALGVTLFIWPNYRQAAAMQSEVDALYQKISGLERQTQVLDELTNKIAQVQQRIDDDLKVIPESPDLAGLIRGLSQEVDRVVVVDQTFTAGSPSEAIASATSKQRQGDKQKSEVASAAPSPEANVMAMPLTIDMEATFHSVFALIRDAELMRRLVRVSSVRLVCKWDDKSRAKNRDGHSPIVKASIGLEAIYHGNSQVATNQNQRADTSSTLAAGRSTGAQQP